MNNFSTIKSCDTHSIIQSSVVLCLIEISLKNYTYNMLFYYCRYFSFVAFIVSTYELEFAQRIKSTSIDGLGTNSGISRCRSVLCCAVLY
jgi:hypothetical protein